MRMDREEALRLAQIVGSQAKACYRNSVLALFTSDEEALYVEGFLAILGGGLLIEHGWLQMGERIIDVTLSDGEVKDYHPIFTYSRDKVKSAIDRGQSLPLYMEHRADILHWRGEEFRFYGLMKKED